ncbi:serine/arginine repetitive matrix protein 1-like [Haliotis rufescens]|uniref:serine/arginine repetitive matrix protein 1-like n=1 Tax=Haliotis rufescens TaxID=6454 RepID=UPI00201ED982|nr:serine/arginine repetitive matrix protein 1-like [Haliotis rufescens]
MAEYKDIVGELRNSITDMSKNVAMLKSLYETGAEEFKSIWDPFSNLVDDMANLKRCIILTNNESQDYDPENPLEEEEEDDMEELKKINNFTTSNTSDASGTPDTTVADKGRPLRPETPRAIVPKSLNINDYLDSPRMLEHTRSEIPEASGDYFAYESSCEYNDAYAYNDSSDEEVYVSKRKAIDKPYRAYINTECTIPEEVETPIISDDIKEPKAKKSKAKKSKAKEPKAKDPKAKEPEAKEPKAKEPEVKEPDAKESKTNEPEPKELKKFKKLGHLKDSGMSDNLNVSDDSKMTDKSMYSVKSLMKTSPQSRAEMVKSAAPPVPPPRKSVRNKSVITKTPTESTSDPEEDNLDTEKSVKVTKSTDPNVATYEDTDMDDISKQLPDKLDISVVTTTDPKPPKLAKHEDTELDKTEKVESVDTANTTNKVTKSPKVHKVPKLIRSNSTDKSPPPIPPRSSKPRIPCKSMKPATPTKSAK